MTNHGARPPPGAVPAAVTFAGLRARYGRRWALREEAGYGLLTAEQRTADGRSIRYLVAQSPAELARKIERAEAAAP